MKISKSFLFTLSLTCLALTSCVPETTSISTSSQTSSSIPTNIIEDSYRNFYEIYVASYYDSNGDGCGDLNGITSKLDYIKDLGYNGIWLMPIFDSDSYHKYDANSYYDIDPSYGTLDDMKTLIKECHDRDIILIIDLMINHSSRNNQTFIDAATAYGKYIDGETLSLDEEKMKDYYVFSKEMQQGYSTVEGYANKTFYVESNFSVGMPEFNLDNPDVVKMFNDIAKYWLDLGVDGFRLDAVIYYFLNETDKNVEFLSNFMDYCQGINEDVYIVGEAWTSSSIVTRYYESGITSFFNFDVKDFVTRSTYLHGANGSYYLKGLKDSITMANGYTPAPFMNNHDRPRSGISNVNSTKIFYGLLSMMNGATFTYYGDEIGLTGSNPPDENVRCYMKWEEGDNFVGKCDNPAGATLKEYVHPSVAVQETDPNSILNYYKKANLLRNQNPEIARGDLLDTSNFDSNNKIITLDKKYQNEQIKIIINISDESTYTGDISNSLELVGTLVIDVENEISLTSNQITIPPYGIAILR